MKHFSILGSLLLPSASVVALAFAAGGCGSPDIQSTWNHSQVVVDGSDADWEGALTTFKDFPGAVGVRNDGRNLYVCVETSDRTMIRRFLRSGLTLWFDPQGGKKQVFGIRYPIGAMAAMASGGSRRPDESAAPADRDRGRDPGQEAGREDVDRDREGDRDADQSGDRDAARDHDRDGDHRGTDSDHDVSNTTAGLRAPKLAQIVGPGGETRRESPVNEMPGITVGLSFHGDRMVYEVSVPLRSGSDAPYAIEAEPGSVIGIGATSGVTFGQRTPREGAGRWGGGGGRGGMGGGMGGGWSRGGRGGGGGGMGMGRGARMGERPQPLEEWAKVKLASERS